MGLTDSHVTDAEFEEWQYSDFEPLIQKAGRVERCVKSHSKQLKMINDKLNDQAAELRRALAEIRATQERITSGFKKLESHLNGNLGERLAPLFRKQLTQIDRKLDKQSGAAKKRTRTPPK